MPAFGAASYGAAARANLGCRLAGSGTFLSVVVAKKPLLELAYGIGATASLDDPDVLVYTARRANSSG
jgi:hypothetical protein